MCTHGHIKPVGELFELGGLESEEVFQLGDASCLFCQLQTHLACLQQHGALVYLSTGSISHLMHQTLQEVTLGQQYKNNSSYPLDQPSVFYCIVKSPHEFIIYTS